MVGANRVTGSTGIGLLTLCLVSFCAPVARSQNPQPQQQVQSQATPYGLDKANVPDAINRVKSGDFFLSHLDLIARAHATEAIPALKDQFVRAQDPLLKQKIAAGLIRLGDRDDVYWDYLVKAAKAALDSDAPSFKEYDANGKYVGGPSPAFEAWMKANHPTENAEDAAEDSIYLQPATVTILAWADDSRAIPYLRQGMSSPNYMVQIASAQGLAELGDEASIPLIIAACQRAPKDVATVLGDTLVYFDTDAAKKAVDQYVPADMAQASRNARANGQKPKPLTAPLYDSTAHP